MAAQVAMPSDVERLLREYEAAWRTGDAHALANLFTEDGYVLPPNGPQVEGRVSIEAHFQDVEGVITLEPDRVAIDDEVGSVGGRVRSGANSVETFSFVLRRDAEGRWRIVSHLRAPRARPAPRPPG